VSEPRGNRAVFLLAALLVTWTVLLVLVVAEWGPLRRLDLRVAADLHRAALDHPGQLTWWKWVSRVLHPDVERIAWALAAVGLWLAKRVRAAVFVVIVMGGAAVLEAVTKVAVARHRPVFAQAVASAAGKSFPSGHALGAVVAFGLLVLLVSRRLVLVTAVVGACAVLLVSYSRLALGVHYLSDVVGGWLLGAAWLLLADWLLADRLLSRPRL
jgi:membrane-associated phospholipid phosphatase